MARRQLQLFKLFTNFQFKLRTKYWREIIGIRRVIKPSFSLLAAVGRYIEHSSVCMISLVQYGVEFAAEHVLPLLMPLLTAQQLNVQQFAKYMLFVKDVLRYISIDSDFVFYPPCLDACS